MEDCISYFFNPSDRNIEYLFSDVKCKQCSLPINNAYVFRDDLGF